MGSDIDMDALVGLVLVVICMNAAQLFCFLRKFPQTAHNNQKQVKKGCTRQTTNSNTAEPCVNPLQIARCARLAEAAALKKSN